jgi:NADH-quinone oxidoreductase subunit L
MGDPAPAALGHDGDAEEGEPPADAGSAPHRVPRPMTGVLWVLAVPTLLLGLVLIRPPALLGEVRIDVFTGFMGTLLSLAGIGWALTAPRLGARDVSDALPAGLRAFLKSGYRLDDVQNALVVRPVQALARVVAGGDRDVVDAYVRGTASGARWAGIGLRRLQGGLATGYVAWLFLGAVLVGLAGVVLS